MAASADEDGDKSAGQARVDRWLRDASAKANVRAGDVPEVWRDVARRIEEMFHPPKKVLRESSAVAAFGRQMLNTGAARKRSPGDEPPTEPPTRERGLVADVMAGQAAAGRPAAWTRAEILVEVGPDGLLRRADIAASSGQTAFDRLALHTVCAAVAERPVPDGCRRSAPCTIHLRWAVEAALRVQPPAVMVPSDPRTGGAGKGVTPLVLGLSFDETKGSVRPNLPFETEVQTRVELIAID
jgi:TonB family protein